MSSWMLKAFFHTKLAPITELMRNTVCVNAVHEKTFILLVLQVLPSEQASSVQICRFLQKGNNKKERNTPRQSGCQEKVSTRQETIQKLPVGINKRFRYF